LIGIEHAGAGSEDIVVIVVAFPVHAVIVLHAVVAQLVVVLERPTEIGVQNAVHWGNLLVAVQLEEDLLDAGFEVFADVSSGLSVGSPDFLGSLGSPVFLGSLGYGGSFGSFGQRPKIFK
jgi:hypothetical protein